jgi:hypothetical protein
MENEFHCNLCLKQYKSKTTYEKHVKLNRCKVPDNRTDCKYCSKIFANKYNKNRHEDICFKKQRTQPVNIIQDQHEILLKENEMLKEQLKTVNITNNIHNNNNNVYITCKFGEENMDHMTRRQLIYLFNRCFGSIPEFAKLTYFNKDVPENCNVYLPSIKDKYACFFNGVKWEMKRKDEIIDNIYETAEAFLIEKFDDLKKGLGKDTLSKYTRWLNEHTQDERENIAKEQIKLLLYNEKDMVIELRKKQSKNGNLESCILSIHSNVH